MTRRSRRQLLRAGALAATAGFGGCITGRIPGPGGAGDATGTEEDDRSEGTPADLSCTAFDDGYNRYDAGAKPLVVDFDYPAVLEELTYQESEMAYLQGKRVLDEEQAESLMFEFYQLFDGKPDRAPIQPESDVEPDVNTTVEVGGETVRAVSNPLFQNGSFQLTVSLPYEVDGETLYFTTQVLMIHANPPETPGEKCRNAQVAAARHILESFESNPESTIAAKQ